MRVFEVGGLGDSVVAIRTREREDVAKGGQEACEKMLDGDECGIIKAVGEDGAENLGPDSGKLEMISFARKTWVEVRRRI